MIERDLAESFLSGYDVDEDGEFFADEGNVGTDGRKTGDGRRETRGRRKTDAAVQAVAAEARVPEGFAERDLGPRILFPISTHPPRNSLARRHRRSFVADIAQGCMIAGESRGLYSLSRSDT